MKVLTCDSGHDTANGPHSRSAELGEGRQCSLDIVDELFIVQACEMYLDDPFPIREK